MSALTPRQRTIDRLVRRGMTSRRIAEQLGISQRTVEVHRANIAHRLSAGPAKDPLDHPAVQNALKRLSHRVAMLATELKQLRAERYSIGVVRAARGVNGAQQASKRSKSWLRQTR